MRLQRRFVWWEGLCLCAVLPLAGRAAEGADNAPDPQRVAELARVVPREPAGVGRPIGDRKAWQTVAAATGFKGLIARAQALLGQPIPELSDDVYLDFSRTGNRRRGEHVLFARHGRVGTLVLGECLEDRGRFLPAIDDAIRAVCEEKTWVMPAHDRGLGNFHGKVTEIDLASSALSWELATADYWLGDRLKPETRKLLRSHLERRTFEPFEGMIRRGKPALWWVTTTSNWNAVCVAGVTGAAMAAIESPERRAFFAAAAEKSLQNFLRGFTPDGYCSEGMGYWNYGFGHFVLVAETLQQATGGRLDLMAQPKVRQVAQFGRRLEILPGVYPAFADCHLGSHPDARIQAFVSRRFGFGWTEEERRGLPLAAGASGSLCTVGVYDFPNSASQCPAAKPSSTSGELRDWFADAGILICRPAPGSRHGMGVALKGGHNAEHHNHNDVGSLVVALGRATPLVDPGAEIYTARTFSGRRYESNVLNSFGHGVPRVAGKLQREGRAAAARVVRTEFTDQADTLVLDIRSAYAVKELKKLQRTFMFSRQGAGSLTVTDEVEFSAPATFGTALITLSPWRSTGSDSLTVGRGPDAVDVRISSDDAEFRVDSTEIHEDLPDRLVPIRLGIELAKPVRQAAIRVTIQPKD